MEKNTHLGTIGGLGALGRASNAVLAAVEAAAAPGAVHITVHPGEPASSAPAPASVSAKRQTSSFDGYSDAVRSLRSTAKPAANPLDVAGIYGRRAAAAYAATPASFVTRSGGIDAAGIYAARAAAVVAQRARQPAPAGAVEARAVNRLDPGSIYEARRRAVAC